MRSNRGIIFVGGIHGVGKSTVCARICADLQIEYLSASKLINDNKAKTSSQKCGKDKRVGDIENNQRILIAALNQTFAPRRNYLIDGHFALFDSNGEVQLISTSTFQSIMPKALIVLTDSPTAIQKKLLLRDGMEYNIDVLASMQEKELSHAKLLGKELGIPVHESRIDCHNDVRRIIGNLIAKAE